MGFSFLFSPIISFLINACAFMISLVVLTKIIDRNTCKNMAACEYVSQVKYENDESKIRIASLETKLIKATTLDKIQKEKFDIEK
jgi:ferredoxin